MLLFRSEHLIVAVKQPGVLSVPARFQDDPRPCLGLELQREFGQIFPVHRLDFEVSGPIIYALTPHGQKVASGWFEHARITKKYHALSEVPARPDSAVQVWKCTLAKGKKRAFEAEHGKPSVTRARCLGDFESQGRVWARWELNPVTGRSHQLRYELARRSGPIWGDRLYGATSDFPIKNAIALSCVALELSAITEKLGLPDKIEHPAIFENLPC